MMKRFWMAGSLMVLSSVACGASDVSSDRDGESVGEQGHALNATSNTAAPAATVPTIRCGPRGTPRVVSGIEACGCADGYAGETCEVCATGYTTGSAPNDCIVVPTNRDVAIEGTDSLVAYGSSVVLSALSRRPATAGAPVPGTWSVSREGGCFAHPDRPEACLPTISGERVLYKAPTTGTELALAEITFTPAGGGPALQQSVKLSVSGEVPINGSADISTLPVVKQVLSVMKQRCVGAASLGIARHGKVVAALGMGMKDGRNAATIFNPACSDNQTDPFKPNAGQMRHDTPYMIGSVSKAPAYATARYAVKKALKEQDVDVRMITQTPSRIVTATRTTAKSLLRIDVWDLDADGTFTRKGFDAPTIAKDFDLVRMGDSRFVVVMRNADDKVNLSAYQIDAQGNPIVTKALFGATVAKQVQVTSVNDQRVVVALRLPNDALQVRTFKLDDKGNLTLLSHHDAGTTRDVRVVGLPGTSRFVRVARLANPDLLEFSVWNVTDAGVLERLHVTTFDGQFFDAREFELTALSGSRIVVGVRGAPDAEVNASVINVAGGSGALDLVGGTFIPGAAGGFRMERADAAHFGVVTYGKGSGRLHRLTVGNSGAPYQEGSAIATGSSRGADLGSTTGIGTGGGFVTSVRTTSDQLALTSWGVQGVDLVKRKGVVDGAVTDYDWQDNDVEGLALIGFDFPNGLVAPRVHSIVAGYVEPPFHADSIDKKASCTATNAPGYPMADSGWKNVRLRDFFGHRTGMNYANVPLTTVLANLGKIRGVTTKAGWLVQQNKERELWSDAQISSARQAAGLSAEVDEHNPDGFLLPRLVGEDLLVASASMCLPNTQGTYTYSNTDPVWIQSIMEHVTGQPYAAPVGNPNAVQGTLLKEFVDANLGFSAGALTGLYARPAAPDPQGNDVFEGPKRRHWDGTTYYPQRWDVKRPYCTEVGDTCTVAGSPWLDWNGKAAKVSLDLSPNGESVATGSLAVQVLSHLAFLKNYWAGGYDQNSPNTSFNPSSGERRGGVWKVDDAHIGGDDGMWAYAIQYGTKCNGNSSGVDITVSFNQWKDKVCTSTSCSDAESYSGLLKLIESAVCTVDWTKAKPVPGLND